jgi:hypothetical protein
MIYNTEINFHKVSAEITHRGYQKDELRPGEAEYDVEILGVDEEGIFTEHELETLVLRDFLLSRAQQKIDDEIERKLTNE